MNTNEQTIHQMGLGISSLVKQATGRESVSNIDMDWVSVEQLARYIYGSGSGDVVSFDTNIADGIVSLIAYITAVQDLHGQEFPYPAGGGKNLVNVDDFAASSTYVTLTINGNEVHAVGNGNASWLNARITGGKKTYSEGTYYVKFKIKSGATVTADTKMCLRTVSGSIVRASTAITSDTLEYSDTWTISEDCYLTLLLNGNTSGSEYATDITVYDLIVSETDVPWEPYSNVCSITGWTGCNVSRTGKNLLNFTALKNAPSGELPGTSAMYTFPHVLELKLKASTKYTISTDYSSAGKQQCLYINGATSSNSVNNLNPRTVTTGEDGVIKVGFFDNRTGSSEFLDGTVYVQLEEGLSASEYEEFGTTYSISWQTEAGTVYGGYLDVLSGVLTVTHKSITFTGAESENWRYSGTEQKARYSIPISDAFAVRTSANARTTVMCNIGSFLSTGIELLGCYIYSSDPGSPRFAYCPPIPYNATESDFKTWLSTNNLQVVYQLAEPITYQLTAYEVTALVGETNNIFADTGNVSVQYKVKEDLV